MASDELRLRFETLSGAIDPETVELVGVRGRAELCRPYEYVLDLNVTVDAGLDQSALDDLLKQPCRISFGPDDGMVELHGILRKLSVPSAHAPMPVKYRVWMVPKIWTLSQIRRSRVFQELDAPGIVTAVLEELGFEADTHFEWHLAQSYPVSEYTVQYQETDLDFVHRILEHFGIFYFFRQQPDGEVAVFTDDNATCVALDNHETLPFEATDAASWSGVTELNRELTPQKQMVLLRDYNWRTPSIGLAAEAPIDEATGRGFHNEYGQHFKTPSQGNALAAVRAEEMMAARDVFTGACRVPGLLPGHKLEISGYPLLDFDQEYLLTAVEQEISGGEGDGALTFASRFEAIPYRVPYRRARTTPKPKIEGVMHATVDGEVPGTAAPIDEYGRYKIVFPFDLVGEMGGKASRWVRLAQPASGAGYGIHFPLHIGVEVAVSHLDGDPDRPIIMNSPPNTETITPVNDANPTQSEIVTKTGIRLTWDDDA